MLEAIGEPTSRGRYQAGNFSSRTRKDLIIQEAESARKTQPSERMRQAESAKSEGGTGERTKNRTKFKDGNIIIETYTENGELVKITPPGYLPFDKIV